MASRVDSSSADDLTVAYRRLSAAYQQTLRYAEDVRRLYQQVQRAIYQSLLGLANALEAKDPYTRGHSERVGAWSRSVAAALGLPPSDVDMIGQAGLLHDIGKIGIPETVLRKPGELDPDEWAVMRNHPLIGAQINQYITGLIPASTGSWATRFRSARASSRWPTCTTR